VRKRRSSRRRSGTPIPSSVIAISPQTSGVAAPASTDVTMFL
jgi:hypothetical protein